VREVYELRLCDAVAELDGPLKKVTLAITPRYVTDRSELKVIINLFPVVFQDPGDCILRPIISTIRGDIEEIPSNNCT